MIFTTSELIDICSMSQMFSPETSHAALKELSRRLIQFEKSEPLPYTIYSSMSCFPPSEDLKRSQECVTNAELISIAAISTIDRRLQAEANCELLRRLNNPNKEVVE